MLKLGRLWFFGICAVLTVTGCATGKNYQSDMDTLNARLNSLQAQMQAKDEELARLRSEASANDSARSAALARAESENREMNERLNAAQAKLEAERAAKKYTVKKTEESDLK